MGTSSVRLLIAFGAATTWWTSYVSIFYVDIDFAHILGDYLKFAGVYKRETAPFVLTPEFIHVMGGVESSNFELFRKLCCDGYNMLRRQAYFLIRLFKLLLKTGIPLLRSEKDLDYLHTAFSLDLDNEMASKKFDSLIEESRANLRSQINFFFHNLVHPLDKKK
jgi:phosphatidylinositol kinase/protein kinase (PI-3  family)